MDNSNGVKQFLNAWLGSRHLGVPIYQEKGQYVQEGVGTVFQMEVHSNSFPSLVGVGSDRTKSNAKSKAARDLCLKLVNIGHMDKADFMSLNIQREDQMTTGGPNPPVQGHEIQGLATADTDEGRWYGWTLDDYETAFDKICQEKLIVTNSKFTPVGYGVHSAIIGELYFTPPAQGSNTAGNVIYAREEDKTRKIALAKCSKKVVHELCDKNIIEYDDIKDLVGDRMNEESSITPLSSVTTEPAVSSTTVPTPNTPRAIKQEIDADSEGNIGDGGPSTSAYNQNEAVYGKPAAKKAKNSLPPKDQRRGPDGRFTRM